MNGISDDVLNVNYGNGDSGSRRPRLYGDGSHQLDTLSVSNSSSRNGSNWFFAFITSLNIMVKNFAKAFVGLSVKIVTRKKKSYPYYSFRRKICKNRLQKWKLHEKLGKEHLDCKKSILAKKSTVNIGQSQQESQRRSVNDGSQRMT